MNDGYGIKRPLAVVALSYIGGILLAGSIFIPSGWVLICTIILALLSFSLPAKRAFLLYPLLVFVGWSNYALQTQLISPVDLRVEIGDGTEQVALRGILSETPSQRRYEIDDKESWRTLAQLSAASLNQNGVWKPVNGRVLVSTSGNLTNNFYKGQSVEISGLIHVPKSPVADGLFDYRLFLQRQGIFYQLDVESTNDWKRLPESSTAPPFAEHFQAWAKRTLAHGLPEEDRALQLTWAMTLGWKTALSGEISEPFMHTGTMHIFAISGLHIALISGILLSLLRVLQLPRWLCGFIIIPLIWFYTGATGWQSSAIRSTIMMTIIIGGWSLKRPGDLLNSLGAAALVVLTYEPQQLFQASFQLSFFVVMSLGFLLPAFENARQRIFKSDPFLPNDLRPRWQRYLDLPVRFITVNFATSLAAWFGSLPLVIYYFNLFTPVSLLANMVVVPLSSLALASNLGSLICGGWFPWLGDLFNHSGWFFMSAMISVSDWFEHIPGAYFYVKKPSLFVCVAYYLILFTTLTGWLSSKTRRRWAGIIICLIGIIWLGNWWKERTTFKITILPLNGGESIFIDAPKKADQILIDCGNESAFNFTLKPFLHGQGINHLPRFLLTHGDIQSVGAATNLIQMFKPNEVLTNSVRFRSPAYRALSQSLQSTLIKSREITTNDQIGLWTVLYPFGKSFPSADDNCTVLRGQIHGKTILLLSDLGRQGQNALLNRGIDLRSDILISGLPHEVEALSDAILDAIQPQLLIITDSEFPATQRASKRLEQRLAKRGIPVFYCRKAGAVTLTIRADSLHAETMGEQAVLLK